MKNETKIKSKKQEVSDHLIKDLLKIKNWESHHLVTLLSISEPQQEKLLLQKAKEIREASVGKNVYCRGLIEFSNYCIKDCYYCGIRKNHPKVKRYNLKKEEIVEIAVKAYQSQLGSIVLQSGERSDNVFIEELVEIIQDIRRKTNNELEITLSVGEQKEEVYESFFKAGAQRYLLRMETTNEFLYKKLHPLDHSFEERKACLLRLKKTGFQVGTGVMIGLPDQTYIDLAKDLLFFQEMDIDMVGMGPFLLQKETPLIERQNDLLTENERFHLSLRMIALLRIMMKDINIAATTALQAIHPEGRELGIKAGANVIMPNMTPQIRKKDYQLYDNKPCLDEDFEHCKNCIDLRVRGCGYQIAYGQSGTSNHFKNKQFLVEKSC